MAVSEPFHLFVQEQLRLLDGVTHRRMFGGIALYQRGLIFGLIDDDVLYLKVDDANRGQFERQGMLPFRPFGPDGASMSYYTVPADVLEDPDQLSRWVVTAIGATRRQRARPKK